MTFPFGQSVFRDRRPRVPSPYNPDDTVWGDWDDATTLEIPGAWIAGSSSARTLTATRTQILTTKSLFCSPDADVLPGDRIRSEGFTYYVHVRPQADRNPFTGWQPHLEVPLEDLEG